MAGVLRFDQYLGGPDQMQIEQAFPSSQRSVVYNFGTDISGYTFQADYQTLVVNPVQFNRFTGQPNFTNSAVVGYFPKVEVTGDAAPSIINSAQGTVLVNFPANMYTGPVLPDARQNVPVVVFAFTWIIPSTVDQIETHRWAFVQAWEPDVALGDPTSDNNFTEL